MKYAQLLADYEEKLALIGEERESLSFTFRALKNLSLTDFILLLNREISDKDKELLDTIFQQLSRHIPPQYIVGYTLFHGLSFQVDPRVLIPRPETEELVDLILKENQSSRLRVLDIGTGSGAIAVALAKERTLWQISATDISHQALEVARQNARNNEVTIDFLQSDVFQEVTGQFDIIVSNPPYISPEDISEVGLNVLHSEPHLALFAQENGLALYRQIAEKAGRFLRPAGKFYFEIGYKQGKEVKQLFQHSFPTKRVRVLQDQFGQDRMVVVDNGETC